MDGRAGVDVGAVQSLLRGGSNWSLASAFPVPLGEEAEARIGVGVGTDGARSRWVLLRKLGVIWGMKQSFITVLGREVEEYVWVSWDF